MKSAPYWTALLIGVFLVYIYYQQSRALERFQTTTSTTTTTTSTAPVAATTTTSTSTAASTLKSADYNEMTSVATNFVNTFPQYTATNNKVFAYLSSFSLKLPRKNAAGVEELVPVYVKNDNLWRNMMNLNDFSIAKDNLVTLPDSLDSGDRKGLPMKGVTLMGPPSENFRLSENDYTLPSFTISFFGRWNTLNFSNYERIYLWEMFAESPNHVLVSVEQKTAATATIDIILGDRGTSYRWDIPISTLLSNGNYTLYTLVFNKESKEIRFYIGSNGVFKKSLNEEVNIRLGNTAVSINRNKAWDFHLRAFVFHKEVALVQSDIIRLNDYFIRESGGLNQVINQAQESLAEATARALFVENKLKESEASLAQLQEQLSQCTIPVEEQTSTPNPVARYSKWSIKMQEENGAPPMASDTLKKCSPLSLNKFGPSSEEAVVSSKSRTYIYPPTDAEKVAGASPFSNLSVQNPRTTPVTTTTPEKPAEPVATAPTTTTTVTTAPAPATTTDNDGIFSKLLSLFQ